MSDIPLADRMQIEKTVDSLLDDPKEFLATTESMLRSVGIDPNLDAVLSFVNGAVFGFLAENFKEWGPEASDQFLELMQRRSWELRQAVIRVMNQ